MSQVEQTQAKKVHKLSDTWVFWYSPRGKKAKGDYENYQSNLTELGEFNTIEDFFSFYCFLMRPCDIGSDNKLMIFRKGCKPMWEEWKDGGCWIQLLKKKDNDTLNRRWEDLLFALIGEDFPDNNVIGLVISKRMKRNLIELWIKDRSEENKIKVGEKLRCILDLDPQNLTFYFKDHSVSLNERSTMRGKESYTFVTTPMETPLHTPQQLANGEKEKLEDFKL